MDDTSMEFMTTAEVAALLRVAESTIRYWRQTRKGPRYGKPGKRVLYRRIEVMKWWERQQQMTG